MKSQKVEDSDDDYNLHLMRLYYIPGSILRVFHVCKLTITLSSRYCHYLYLPYEETEVERRSVTCARSNNY